MDLSKVTLVICLTLVGVIAVNAIIYFVFRRGVSIPEIEVLKKITDRSRQPWKQEQEELDELSKLVENLKQTEDSNDTERNQ